MFHSLSLSYDSCDESLALTMSSRLVGTARNRHTIIAHNQCLDWAIVRDWGIVGFFGLAPSGQAIKDFPTQ